MTTSTQAPNHSTTADSTTADSTTADSTTEVTIIQPDDWHLHLRDEYILNAVLPATSCVFARAIVMPNLTPPVTTVAAAVAYRERIETALPQDDKFTPLMTAYLTDTIDPMELQQGHQQQVFTAAKLYPAGATTNSEHGVTDIRRIYSVLETMQRINMPLLVHGEVTDPSIDVFDRETVFVDTVLDPLRRDFPELRIVFEHITTRHGVDYVSSVDRGLGATITPHHLMIDRNALFHGGLRPHMYCLPIAKRQRDLKALQAAATSGDRRFFLGTDSAPHVISAKEKDCGCAGIFNTPVTMSCLAEVFCAADSLDRLEAFTSVNGAKFYELPENTTTITLRREPHPVCVPASIQIGDEAVRIFDSPQPLHWRVM